VLKLNCDILLSTSAIKLNSRRYNLDVVELLLGAAGVNVNKARHDGATALYMAGPMARPLVPFHLQLITVEGQLPVVSRTKQQLSMTKCLKL
jgi:hypothetical protein